MRVVRQRALLRFYAQSNTRDGKKLVAKNADPLIIPPLKHSENSPNFFGIHASTRLTKARFYHTKDSNLQ
jgi:hypothetical protein